jgi:hypothetical protein
MIGRIKSAPDVDCLEGGGTEAEAEEVESSGACIVMTESDMASSSILVSGDWPESVRVNWGTAKSALGSNADGVRSRGLSSVPVGSGVASGSDGDMSLISVGVDGVFEGTGLRSSLTEASVSVGANGLYGSPSGRSWIGGSDERPSGAISHDSRTGQ